MSGKRVLIIDDELNMRHMLQIMLSKSGYEAETASNGFEGLEKMKESNFDFILCDLKMPKMDGMTFLKKSREQHPGKTFIMMSAYGSIDDALEAMKIGAYDYISKPFKTDEVLLTLKKAEERERLKAENISLQKKIRKIEQRYSFGNIVARSEAMRHVFELVSRVADHKTTVLITGESGTGKDLIARAIHESGSRASGPMVSINCGGIPENLLESELFGYKQGAFTDAVKDKPGRFEEANGGTIFLDEIGDLPLPLQVKLLRVLQEQEITPLGGVGSKKIDVRVIAATSKDLKKETEENRFREDLFYRINVMTIHLPPLRERRGDIPLLIGYFIDQFNKKLGKEVEGLSSEAMPILMGYGWPGNIRELENVIERAVLLARDRWITPEELPSSITSDQAISAPVIPEGTLSIKKASKLLERDLIKKVLDLTGGNKTQAAKILEISRPKLLSKIKAYNLDQ
ncbi:MAG: sigma-54-dependent Fis family transcriptional regulator [Deltaproteobacteria bacterium]|nr:sigma-54-dependent Fis family transcriptional regulator [Deltaproteobacteria bacterium]MBW1977627.1 sigma-54-dependent Fis family transcriptional regulator [Deltaproteobacteria bacterium]MBW2045799.1 sigma-54-dependent Fis family transcriptional regulator [Deltaproteobacteria bacterium]MBW2299772.1 sigma-54-dependent Fis family transcriptional regulator [Deltaproteobacteria bacterium]